MKSTEKIVKIIELRAKGLNMEDIGKELGITRQTVSTYLHTPEAQVIATELQERLLATLKGALSCVDKAIKLSMSANNPKDIAYGAGIARDIAVNLGKMVLSQTPQATESRERLSEGDRQALIDRIRDKLAPIKDAAPINSITLYDNKNKE